MNQKLLKELVTAKGNLFTGNIPEINGDPLNFYIRTREKYGDYIKYPLLPKMYLYGLYHPDAVQHVLQKKNYVKPAFFYNATRPFFGNGLFTSEGESWLRQRRLAQPAFHKKNLEFFSKIMNQSIMELIEKWETAGGTLPSAGALDRFRNLSARWFRLPF